MYASGWMIICSKVLRSSPTQPKGPILDGLRWFHFAEQINRAELDQVLLFQRQCVALYQPRVKSFARAEEIHSFLRQRKHKGPPSQPVRHASDRFDA